MSQIRWIILSFGFVALTSWGVAQQSRTIVFSAMATGTTDATEINAGNLRVTLNGKRVGVLSVSQAPVPGHLVIAIDASGSFREKRKWNAELLAARETLEILDKSWRVTVMPFSYGAETDFPQLERNDLTAKLNEMSRDPAAYVKGPSQIRDATIIAIKVFKLTPSDAVLLLTDGLDNDSNLPPNRFLEMMLKPQVRVFGGIVTASPSDMRRAAALMQALRGSGGMAVALKVPDFDRNAADPLRTKGERGNSPELIRAVSDLLSAITRANRAELDLPATVSGDVRVEILNPEGKPAKNLTVLAPQQLLPVDTK
jgi:hypothetical protein